MIYFFLPALLTAGLIWWGLDECGDEEVDSRDLTNGDDDYKGDDDIQSIDALAGNDIVSTLGGDDVMRLGAGNDTGVGGAGNDEIYGGPGNDLLNGGEGNDRVFGNQGDDILNGPTSKAIEAEHAGQPQPAPMTAAEAGLRQDLFDQSSDAGNDWLRGGDGDDFISDGEGKDTMYGDLGNDTLRALDRPGTDGADQLFGGWGEDTLWGDDGDTLTGGGDKDTFFVSYEASSDAPVTITDYEIGEPLQMRIKTDDGSAPDVALVNKADGTVQAWSNGQHIATLQAAKNGNFTKADLSEIRATLTVL